MNDTQTRWDIVGIGAATVDELLIVDHYPLADSKQEVIATDRHGGGLVATASVASARLGVATAYVDVLGEDDLSHWVIADFEREGVDTSLIARHPDARPIHAFIIVEQGTGSRTILFTTAGHVPPTADKTLLDAVRAARVLMIDDVSTDPTATIRAMETARAAGVAVVADIERRTDAQLLALADHLIVSSGYAARTLGETDPAAAARAFWREDRAAVVITCGIQGSWYLDGTGEPQFQPAFTVQAVDTTGCGDVFHGAYAAGLVWGLDLPARVRLASAVAALKATQLGGRRGIPTRAQAEAFMAGA
ncbi:MAG: permease [Anaerolineae bacterium]|nr:permease [Anaerolineae bacterium]